MPDKMAGKDTIERRLLKTWGSDLKTQKGEC